MSLTVLFDLDDTLLRTNLDQFLPVYFDSLSQALSHVAPKKKLTQQIHEAVKIMAQNQDPGRLLADIFAENFYPPLGTTVEACRENVKEFYQKDFSKLKTLTQQKPEASGLIRWCHSQNYQIAVATNPLFPEAATRQRIEWAGLNPQDFAFFSTFDNFHFTKPNLAYYAEVLGRLGWAENPVIMVGDHLSYDLMPVEKMGFQTFWIDPEVDTARRPQGDLSSVKAYLENFNHSGISAFNTLRDDPEVQIAILRATPAVLDTFLNQTPKQILNQNPDPHEWSFTEVLWHLAQMETLNYLPQWEVLFQNPLKDIVISPEKTKIINQGIQSNNSETAFKKFLEARRASLSAIESLWEKGLFEVSVNHPVFSETKISELISFSAKHDRIHLRQCFNLINL